MNASKIIFVLACFLPFMATAQKDSLNHKNILLKEVLIQNEAPNKLTRRKMPAIDLQTSTEKLLETISGVDMIRRGNYAWEPTIRGLNAGQINMTIDGMAIFGACTDRMDPISSYIEPNNLQSVLVSYSASGVSAGSTIGGGLNFKIRQPRLNAPKVWGGMAGIGYETNGNALQTLAALDYSKKNFALNANGIFRNSGDYRAGGGKRVLYSQYSKWNGGLSAKYKLSEHHFLTADYIRDEGYNIGYPGLKMDVAYAKANIASIAHLYSNDQRTLNRWETKIYFNHIDHAMDDTKRPESQVPVHMDMPGSSRTFGFYSAATLNFNNRHHIKVRLSAYQNKLHAEMTMYPKNATEMFMLTIPDAERLSTGLNISDHYQFSKRLSFIYGAQLNGERSSIFSEEGRQTLSGMYQGDLAKTRILYNIFLNPEYQINNNWSLNAHIARAMRAPTLKELYSFYIFVPLDNYDYIGNPDLKTEKSWNASLGGDFKKGIFEASLQAYSYFFRNYIAGIREEKYSVMTSGADGVKQYGNLSSAVLYGIESAISLRPFSGCLISSRNTFEQGQDGMDRALPRIPPFKSVNEIRYRYQQYHFSLEGIFAAAQRQVNTGFYGETESPAFGVLNIKAGKAFLLGTSSLSVNIAVENLLDNNYYEHLDLMKVPRPGRNFLLHLTLLF